MPKKSAHAERTRQQVHQSTIMIVDDHPQNIRLLASALELAGFERLLSFSDPLAALQACTATPPDLLILDLHMPGIDGFEMMRQVGSGGLHEGYLPILVVTADATERTRRRALAAGATDFLTKPFGMTEAVLRIRNLLETRALYTRVENQKAALTALVRERTRELEAARLEVLERLCQAVEFRDDVTGKHTRRVGMRSAQLAAAIGLPPQEVELIRLSAPLHDVGKIAIPDAILLKPGNLTDDEFRTMQEHTVVGARILAGGRTSLMATAASIAQSHHERWDGSGYPTGLRGEAIPLAARIVAIVDVFDAVTSPRPYRPAWAREKALDVIKGDSGSHFDPHLVDAFVELERMDRPSETLGGL